jgi:hypothetical protein
VRKQNAMLLNKNSVALVAVYTLANGKGVYTEGNIAAAKNAGRIQDAHIRVYRRSGQIVPDHSDVIEHDGVVYCRVMDEESDAGMSWTTAHNGAKVGDELAGTLDAAWSAANPGKPNVFDRGLMDEATPVKGFVPPTAPVVPSQPASPLSVEDQIAAALAKFLPTLAAQATAQTTGNGKTTGKGKGAKAEKGRREFTPQPKMEFKVIKGRNGDFRKIVVDDGRTYNPMNHAQISARQAVLIRDNAEQFWTMVNELAMEADE